MYGCKSWTIKKAEHWRINAVKLWCWRRLLRVPWTERRSNQSILKEMNPKYSLEGLTLKLQYFGHLMWRVYSIKKYPDAGKIEDQRIRGRQRMRWLDTITNTMDMNLSKLKEIVKEHQTPGLVKEIGKPCVLQPMGSQRVALNWTTEEQVPPGKPCRKQL